MNRTSMHASWLAGRDFGVRDVVLLVLMAFLLVIRIEFSNFHVSEDWFAWLRVYSRECV